MQVGDLVKYCCPAMTQINKTFLISQIDEYGTWVQFYGTNGWRRAEDVKVIDVSR